MAYGHIIPEWLWVIVIGGILIGLIKSLWGQRNKGLLSIEDHIKACAEVRDVMNTDIERISKSFSDALAVHSKGMMDLLNAKFESLDDKIENKVLRQIKSMGNGRKRLGKK